MFVSDSENNKSKYSEATLSFMDEYAMYEKKLVLNKPLGRDLKSSIESLVNYLQNYRISFSLFLGASGFLLLTNHLNNTIMLVVLYSIYHYVIKMLRKKERVKDLELNKVRRSIFFNEVFLKNKERLLGDLFSGQDDLGLFYHYKKKNIENSLNESDMDSIVSLLKNEVKKQQILENESLSNFVRKLND